MQTTINRGTTAYLVRTDANILRCVYESTIHPVQNGEPILSEVAHSIDSGTIEAAIRTHEALCRIWTPPADRPQEERQMNAHQPAQRDHNYTDEEIATADFVELGTIRDTLLEQIATIQRQIASRAQSSTLSAAAYHAWVKTAQNAIHLRERQLRDVKTRTNTLRREVRAQLPGGDAFLYDVTRLLGMLRRLRAEGCSLSDTDEETLARVECAVDSLSYDSGYGPVTVEDLAP